MPYSIAPYPPSPTIQVNGTPAAATAINFGSGLTSTLSGGVLTVSASGGGSSSVTFTVATSRTFTATDFAGYSQITILCNGPATVTLPALTTLDSTKWIKIIDFTGQAVANPTNLTITGGGTFAYGGDTTPTALPLAVFQGMKYNTQPVTLPNTGSTIFLG